MADESFDVALCQFGLMFVDDPVQALREMHRVLRGGGRLGIAVWSVPERLGVFLLTRVVSAAMTTPVDALPHAPWRLGEPGLIESLVTEAGFQDVLVEPITLSFVVDDAAEEWQRWRDNPLQPLVQVLDTLPEERQHQIRDEAIAALETLREDSVIRVPSEALLVSAVR